MRYKRYIYPFSFLFGIILSSGVLSFQSDGYVNLLYFLLFVVIIPFLISLVSLLFGRAYKESSLAGLLFSFGAFVAILFILTFKFVPFGWSSTIKISPESFYNFIGYFAFWKSFCKECMPSIELVRISHYPFSKDIDPTKLGEWWKFLVASIFFYGVLFRFLIYLISLFLKPKKIEFISNKDEPKFEQIDSSYDKIKGTEALKNRDFKLLGYYVDTKRLNIQDNPDAKDIVIAVKSYEPPILDFFDYLDEIKEKNKNSNISLLMIGVDKPLQKDVDVWIRKLKELGYRDIEVIR